MTHGMMAAWLDITPDVEDEFSDWYFQQHVPERVSLPGFQSGRRYTAPGDQPNKYLALYETTSKAVFASAAYRERLDNPTEWTTTIMPHFRNFVRSVFDVRLALGDQYGGTIATIRYASGADAVDWLTDDVLPGLMERSGICRVRLLEADEEQSVPDTDEARMRAAASGNAWAPWTISVEGIGMDWVVPAVAEALAPGMLADHGATDISTGYYDLVFGMENRKPD